MTKTCTVPGCDQPRMTNRKGKTLTMCEAHQKEYWREHKSSRDGSRSRKPKPAAAPVLPPPEQSLHIRIVALRCTVCGVKQPYTAEVFDVAANARVCRRCAEMVTVVVMNAQTNTARVGRITLLGETQHIGDSPEAYAAFARERQAVGQYVVVEW